MEDIKVLKRILNRTRRSLYTTKNSIVQLIQKQINEQNAIQLQGLLSVYLTSYSAFQSSYNLVNKNDYYGASILLIKIYENCPVFVRLFNKNKLTLFYSLCSERFNINKYYKMSQEKQKDIDESFKELSNIKHSFEHFVKTFSIDEKESKLLMRTYEMLCTYKHLNLIKYGQYRNHYNQVQTKLIGKNTFDNAEFMRFVSHYYRAFEILMGTIFYITKKYESYNKQLSDNISKAMKMNRLDYNSISPNYNAIHRYSLNSLQESP